MRTDRGGGPRDDKPGRGPKGDRGPGWKRADRGPRDDGPGRGRGRGPDRDWAGRGPGPGGGPGRPDDGPREWREARGPERPGPRGRGPGPDRDWRGYDERVPASRFASRRWDGGGYRWAPTAYAPIRDCPPGFARYGDGCVVPAEARRLDPARGWAEWYPARYQDDGYDWRYDNGYLYGVDPDAGGGGLLGNGGGGLLAAIVPLLGGALFGGNLWPQQATDYQVPDYYDRFYGDGGSDGRYDYRYADDAVFAVDPQSQRIDSIAGLLTGDAWSIGQRMPAGYDLYNIPPQYRGRYPDGPDALYRYSDGYVYQVDPRTRLVRSVSELL